MEAKESTKVLPLPLQPQKLGSTVKNIISNDDSNLDHVSSDQYAVPIRDVANSSTFERLSPIPSSQPSSDLLFASPIFNYNTFDTSSLIDEPSDSTDDLLLTAEFRGGLTNINYDFDLSDNSNENSVSEDIKINLAEFDPLLKPPTPPFDKQELPSTSCQINTCSLNISNDNTKSLLDSDSPTNEPLLPSPLKPTTDYRGFSTFEIPTISCNTGDFSSLNYSVNNDIKTTKIESNIDENKK